MNRLLLAAWLASCELAPLSNDWRQIGERPADVDAVIAAVGAMPECDKVRTGGLIAWRLLDFDCTGSPPPAEGCAHPFANPARIDLVLEAPAWKSALAHELCHVCGYQDEPETNGCAERAYRSRAVTEPYASGAWKETLEVSDAALNMIDAVAGLPECGEVRRGGSVVWHGAAFQCQSAPIAYSCASVGPAGRRVDVVAGYSDSVDLLGARLCELCGYEDPVEARACALHARYAPAELGQLAAAERDELAAAERDEVEPGRSDALRAPLHQSYRP